MNALSPHRGIYLNVILSIFSSIIRVKMKSVSTQNLQTQTHTQTHTIKPPVQGVWDLHPIKHAGWEGESPVGGLAVSPAPHGGQLGHGAVREWVQRQGEGEARPVLRVNVPG